MEVDESGTDSEAEMWEDGFDEEMDALEREEVSDERDMFTEDEVIDTVMSFLEIEELKDYNWKRNDKASAIPTFKPLHKPGPSRVGAGTSLEFFQLFFDDALFEKICYFTNKNAHDKKESNPNKNKGKWRELTVPELKTFFAVRIVIEMTYSGRYEHIWSNSGKWSLIEGSGIRDVISRDRFFQIHRYLHYCDESSIPSRHSVDFDRLYKIRLLLDHLQSRFREEYVPDQEMSIDECMVPFRGRLAFRQYHKDKPIKWGVKVWLLAESKTGILNIDLS